MNQVAELEHAAFDAWPAEEVERLAGWRLRAMRGLTRRGNSVWANELTGDRPLSERIAAVEAFYEARHLPSMFQLGPIVQPPELDAELESRGYVVDAPVSVQVAAARTVARADDAHDATISVRMSAAPSAEFLWVLGERGRFGGESLPVFRGLLARIGPRLRCGVTLVDRKPVAAGFVVLDGTWAGVFSMRTDVDARCRGFARVLLSRMAAAAVEEGATRLWLQVERDNRAALSLYGSAGFREVYAYHYRRR
jgi:ribosomal protein S18 acetylase RimI-like enzyme